MSYFHYFLLPNGVREFRIHLFSGEGTSEICGQTKLNLSLYLRLLEEMVHSTETFVVCLIHIHKFLERSLSFSGAHSKAVAVLRMFGVPESTGVFLKKGVPEGRDGNDVSFIVYSVFPRLKLDSAIKGKIMGESLVECNLLLLINIRDILGFKIDLLHVMERVEVTLMCYGARLHRGWERATSSRYQDHQQTDLVVSGKREYLWGSDLVYKVGAANSTLAQANGVARELARDWAKGCCSRASSKDSVQGCLLSRVAQDTGKKEDMANEVLNEANNTGNSGQY
ncbi:hypothetical protein EV361DRAFT_1034766 [Lentinula raphanica]|nr:hypothetical protein EV361DRAFT_1034766 [Lentinula raphanica]